MGLFSTLLSGYELLSENNARDAEIDARNAETNARFAEIAAKNAETETLIKQEDKRHLREIRKEVSQQIDSIVRNKFSNEKDELLSQLADLSILLKAYRWHNVSGGSEKEEAKIRNKFSDALFEKFKQGVLTLKMIDINNPQLNYYEKIQKRTGYSRFFRKYPIYILIIASILIIILFFLIILS